VSHVAKDGEDNTRAEDAGGTVANGDQDSVSHAVVVEPVIGSKAEVATTAASKGENDLEGSRLPDVHVQQLLPLGGEEEGEAKRGALQGESANAEDQDEDVGDKGGEVGRLAL